MRRLLATLLVLPLATVAIAAGCGSNQHTAGAPATKQLRAVPKLTTAEQALCARQIYGDAGLPIVTLGAMLACHEMLGIVKPLTPAGLRRCANAHADELEQGRLDGEHHGV